jgi:N-acetylneuraminic acid mutarotase
VGGLDAGFNVLNGGNVYDPGSNSWSPIASMTGQREKPAVAAIDGKLYVVGGWDEFGNPDATLEIYDPASNTWSTGAPVPTPYGGGPAGVNLEGKFYVIGGCSAFACGTTDVFVYDPASDSWATAAAYPEATSWLGCGAIGGQIFCAGGVSDAGSSFHTYVYDPSTDTWTQLADVPQDQWAMGYIASDDLLYISGGVTDGFNTITNEGFGYDPGADTWTPIANSNNTVYRGASACGFYKIGGSVGGFSPVPNSEVHPGLTNCGGAVDVPWLSENPTTGTIPPGGSQIVDVTLDASQSIILQPGDFFAHLNINEDTPTTVPDVNVTMHVPLPADWGTLEGTVNGLDQCDVGGGPLEGATVFVDTAGVDYTLQTDANGHYQVSFPAADSPVTITVSADKFVTEVRPGVVINAGQTTTENFILRLDAPCISAAPPSLEVTLDLGDNTTVQTTLTNTGAGAANFELKEANGHVTISAHKPAQGSGAPVMRIKGEFYPGRSKAEGFPSLKKSGSKPLSSVAAHKGEKPEQLRQIPPPRDPPWTDIANYPMSIMDDTCAEIDGLIYCVGGLDSGFNVLSSGNVYDPASDTWSPIASMSNVREKPSVAAIDGLLYVVGGWDTFGTPVTALEIYDPSSDTWSTGASIPTAAASAPGANVDGQFYVVGGCIDGGCSVGNNVYSYDPSSDTWSSKADYPTNISWNACASIGGQLYCTGGFDGIGESNKTFVYDPGADTWSPLANLPQTQWAMGFIASDELFYISGGVTDNFATVTNEGFVYDPGADTWTAIANSNNTLYRGGSACGFYRVGGSSAGFTPDPSSEVLPGLTNCGGALDVPWLSENPVTGTLAPNGGSQVIDVTFDAGVPEVTDPGDYLAHIRVDDGTSYPDPNINVTMHVEVPEMTIDDHSQAEGNSGITMFPITVHLSKPGVKDVTVDYATADGTAEAGVDYVAKSGTLMIPAGQTSGVININVIGDMGTEPDETFFVNLSNAKFATITDGQAQVTILNDDVTCPVISLDDTLPDGQVKKAYTGTITASGGTPPYSFAVTSGAIPPGLTLSATGTLSGTPTQGGTFNFVVTATDALGCTGNRLYTVKIKGKKK